MDAPETERIVAVAINQDGTVYSLPPPNRHPHLINQVIWPIIKRMVNGEQGFLTNTGRFVDRVEGAKIAVDSGQIPFLRWPPLLYSEDLW